MNKLKYILLIFTLVVSLFTTAQAQTKMNTKGTLLIMGGDCTNDFFISHFAGLVGGIDKDIIIIPTAMEERFLDSESDLDYLLRPFRKIGFKNIKIVHTRDKNVANSDSINKIILSADGVWITGGRQWRLAKAYNDTKVITSLKTLLNTNKVVSGTSAGASIMADVLVRGDSTSSTVMLGQYKNGFNLVNNFAIDQHHLARNRQFDMFEIKEKHPNILGIGIDENTGIVLNENKFKVIGKSYVSIYDQTRWSEERDTIYPLTPNDKEFYLLTNSYEYDIINRKPIRKNDRETSKPNKNLLKEITGTYYQLKSKTLKNPLSIKVTLEGETVFLEQSWNNAKYSIAYQNLTTFFRPNSISAYQFEKDKTGEIDSFWFFQYAYGNSKWVKE